MTAFFSRIYDAWLGFWFAPQKAHRIALLRIVAPLAILGLLSSRLWNFREFFTSAGYHVPDLLQSRVQQPYYIHPIGELLAHLIAILLVLSGLCVSLGLVTRPANVLFAGLLGYASLFDRVSAVSVNKLGTTVMIALCFCPSGARYSLDALLRRRPAPDEFPGAPLRFLQVQLAVMYCASGLCKTLQGDWLKNGYVLWSQIQGHYQTAFAYFFGGHLPSWLWPPLQALVLGYELLAPLLLSLRRTRGATLCFGFLMHFFVALLFRRIVYFSVLMMSLLTLFLSDRVQLFLLSLPTRLFHPQNEANPR